MWLVSCSLRRGCRAGGVGPFRIDVSVDLLQPDVAVHVAVDVVFREHEVHAVARGLVIIAPLEPRAEEGKLVEQVVDDGLRHALIPRGIAAIVGEVVILRAVVRGLDAVV